MSLDNLLNGLEKVKRTANGKYMACCPAHKDKTASLTINDIGDGRILLNCFAGCDTYSILRSIGLDWQDVMPDSPIDHVLKRVKQLLYPSEALILLKFETQVVLAIAFEMRKNKMIDNETVERLEKSMQIIHKACEAANV